MYSEDLGARIMQRNEGIPGGFDQGDMELYDYQPLPDLEAGIPGGGSESPVDFLKEESLKFDAVSDLDRLFERLYDYHREQGFTCIVLKWVLELLCLAFTIGFSALFLLLVDWHALVNLKCPPCDLLKQAMYEHPLQPFTLYRFLVVTYLVLMSLYWLFCFIRFFLQLKETLEIRQFYHKNLGLMDDDVRMKEWSEVLDRIVPQSLCIVRHLSAHDIVMRIMRKENYMIGMVNKGVFALPLPHWVPGAGPRLCRGFGKKRLYLSKTLEWTLEWCILQYMFDRRFAVKREFLNNPQELRKRFRIVGIVMLVLSPFLIMFLVVFLFLRHAEDFYHRPSTAVSRRWSNLARWIFREFNELDHLFNRRLSISYDAAVTYVKQFPSPIVNRIAKFIAFVFGGLVAVLLIIALMDESLLEAQIFGRNLIWMAAVFGTITAISKQCISEESHDFDPENFMRYVAQHTHYMPKHWRGAEYTVKVREEFERLFQYTGVMLLEELLSIFVTPYILIFLMPECVDDILHFIRAFTVNIPGVGDVCSLSVFDFEHHGNVKYGSPCMTAKDRRSTQGKMEKSFLSFKNNYPNWEPDPKGKQFLNLLAQFRTRHEDPVTTAFPSLSSTILRDTLGAAQSVRHTPRGSMRHSTRNDCLTLSNSIYWLDQYYTSQSNESPSQRREQALPVSSTHSLRQAQQPRPVSATAAAERLTTDSRWWARRVPGSVIDGDSVFRPPVFTGGANLPTHDSESDEDRESDWLKRQSRSSFMSAQAENDGIQFELPFGDVYEKPREGSIDNKQQKNETKSD